MGTAPTRASVASICDSGIITSRARPRRCALVLLATATLAAGCARLPDAIRAPPPGDLRLAEVAADPARHAGTPVRWGGRVVNVSRRDDGVWLEVVERELHADGEPRQRGRSDGRFLARLDAGADDPDPIRGREVTVAGTVEGAFAGSIGREPYTFPVVAAEHWYAWLEPPGAYPGPWHGYRYYRWYGHPYAWPHHHGHPGLHHHLHPLGHHRKPHGRRPGGV